MVTTSAGSASAAIAIVANPKPREKRPLLPLSHITLATRIRNHYESVMPMPMLALDLAHQEASQPMAVYFPRQIANVDPH